MSASERASTENEDGGDGGDGGDDGGTIETR
jgi:hypothetical protein